MQKPEDWENETQTIRTAFEEKISKFLSSGIPNAIVAEILLMLYFDSLRITVDNVSIHQLVGKSYSILRLILFKFLSTLSNESTDQDSSEEEKLFTIKHDDLLLSLEKSIF